MNHRRLRPLILLPIVLLALVSFPTSASAGPDSRTIEAYDDCEVASFNAAVGPGTCVGDGETTFDDFIGQLVENGNVPNEAAKDWDFSREDFGLDAGGRLKIVNLGGEFHTFTEVAAFGGSCIPLINDLLNSSPNAGGTLDVIPECSDLGTTLIPPGGKLTVKNITPGVHRYQCLIHPWMQSTAIVE